MTADLATAAQAAARYYYKCTRCTEPVALEGDRGPDAIPACSYCSGKLRFMGKVWPMTSTSTWPGSGTAP